MTTYSDRLLAAIDETERIAQDFRHGIGGAAGPWVTGEIATHLVDTVVYRPSPDMYDRITHVCNTEYAGSDAVQLARHIARSADPDTVVRRCAADRRIVELAATETFETGGLPLAIRILGELAKAYGLVES